MSKTSMSPPIGASVWEHELFDYLVDHIRREGAMLQEYVDAAESTDSKALQYVVGLLVQDERRHHKLFEDLASSLKAESELAGEEPVIPRLDLHRVERDDLRDLTQRLLEHEREDAKELKRLRKALRDVADTTLWGLVVDTMMRDTDKHIAILRFIADRAHAGH